MVTPANVNDTQSRPRLTRQARERHPWLTLEYLLADRGYDALSNHRYLLDQGITPVIHIRKPTAGDGLCDGTYNRKGYQVRLGNARMKYLGTDLGSGRHLFQCPTEGCALMAKWQSLHHCDSRVAPDPQENPRTLGPLPRFTREWQNLYRQRMSIERTFRSLKHSRGLDLHCARGSRKYSGTPHVAADLPGHHPGPAAGRRRRRYAADDGPGGVPHPLPSPTGRG